jgi:hypothetical protein
MSSFNRDVAHRGIALVPRRPIDDVDALAIRLVVLLRFKDEARALVVQVWAEIAAAALAR